MKTNLPPRPYQALVEALAGRGYPKSPQILDAFTRVDRSDFLPPNLRGRAYEDVPLPIGFGQMTTQPFIVAFLLELLEPKAGANILEIGAGSGWQTALLAQIVGATGQVWALEIVPELKAFSETNLARYRFGNVSVILADGSHGWADRAPYDGIAVSAAVPSAVPKEIIAQLKVGGRLVIPVGRRKQKLHLVERRGAEEYREKTFGGFSFPPMMSADRAKV